MTEQRAFEDNAATQAQIVALQKQDDLESFAIKRSEPEQDQSPPETSLRNFDCVRTFEQGFTAAIVGANPAAPINLVEEPVHDHEQDDDRKQSGCGLQIERRHVVAERAHDAHGDEPGDQAGAKCEACAQARPAGDGCVWRRSCSR